MIKLNSKLEEISKFVNIEDRVYDIGCDHGLLDIYLVKKLGIFVHAVDNKEGPLDSAKKNSKIYNVNNIVFEISNGLDKYNKENCVIMAGIGGLTCINIFKSHKEYIKNIDKIIVSANNFQIEVRKYFTSIGYKIEKEILVKDKKIIYEIEVFVKGKEIYNKKDYFFGPRLLENKNNLFNEYYDSKLKSKRIILKLMGNKYFFRRIKLNNEIKMIEDEI